MINWTTKKVKVADLKEYKENPRIFTEKGIEDLKKSIQKFGVAEPIVCNPDLTIIGGHARKKTLELLNIKEVIAYIPERNLTKKEIKELNIRLNKNIAGKWDLNILLENFETSDLLNFGFEKYELNISDIDFENFFSDRDREERERTETLDRDEQLVSVKCPNCGTIFNIQRNEK